MRKPRRWIVCWSADSISQLREALNKDQQKTSPSTGGCTCRPLPIISSTNSESSNAVIDKIFRQYSKQFSDKELGKLLGKRIDNHVSYSNIVLHTRPANYYSPKYGHTLNEEDRKDVLNSDIIWKGLANMPPSAHGSTTTPGYTICATEPVDQRTDHLPRQHL